MAPRPPYSPYIRFAYKPIIASLTVIYILRSVVEAHNRSTDSSKTSSFLSRARWATAVSQYLKRELREMALQGNIGAYMARTE